MKEILFFKNHAENKEGRPVPDLFFYLKSLYDVKASDFQLSVNIYR